MKHDKCPKCGCEDLGDIWCNHRKLQQCCHAEGCNWKGEKRTPEIQEVTGLKELRIDDFPGWDYIAYDKFGQCSCISCTYPTKAEAMKHVIVELENGRKNPDDGPYTVVLFNTPPFVTIKGEFFT